MVAGADRPQVGDAQAALADLTRRREEGALAPWQEDLLKRLEGFPGWGHRFRLVLKSSSRVAGQPDPAEWAWTTGRWHVSALVYVLKTLGAVGIVAAGFEDLQAAGALRALQDRLRPEERRALDGAGPPPPRPPGSLEQTWGGVYLNSILCSMRTVGIAAGVPPSPELTRLITFYDGAERRDLTARMFDREEYLDAAMTLNAFGRIAAAAGKRRYSSVLAGSRLLAVLADGSPRRGEAGSASRELVLRNEMADVPEFRVFIPSETSKARRSRILVVRDPRAVRLLGEACQGSGGGRLFRFPDGRPIDQPTLDRMLRRLTEFAMGVPASFNLIRRANARAERTGAARKARLGHEGAEMSERYHNGLQQEGASIFRAAREARLAVAAPGNNTAASMVPEPRRRASLV